MLMLVTAPCLQQATRAALVVVTDVDQSYNDQVLSCIGSHAVSPLPTHRVRRQLVNVPSYVVRLDSQKHIDFSIKSPFGGSNIIGRTKRRKSKRAEEGGEEEEDD